MAIEARPRKRLSRQHCMRAMRDRTSSGQPTRSTGLLVLGILAAAAVHVAAQGIVDEQLIMPRQQSHSLHGLDLGLHLPDAEAEAGRLFRAPLLPRSQVSRGSDSVIAVYATEAGQEQLPRWMSLDANAYALAGVPEAGDVGEYYINVTAVFLTADNAEMPAEASPSLVREHVVTDIFMVSVAAALRAPGKQQRGSINECMDFEVMLIVDAAWSSLSPELKVSAVNDVAWAGGQEPSAWRLSTAVAESEDVTTREAQRLAWHRYPRLRGTRPCLPDKDAVPATNIFFPTLSCVIVQPDRFGASRW